MSTKTIKKHSGFTCATDGTYTMDGSTDCMPASTNFTSDGVFVGDMNEIAIFFKCDFDFTVAIVTKYEISYDGVTWLDGVTAITALDTGVEDWITLDAVEVGVRYIRFNANNTNAETGKVWLVLSYKA